MGLDCGLRRNDDGRGDGTHPPAPSPTFGEGMWIAAYAAMTGAGWVRSGGR